MERASGRGQSWHQSRGEVLTFKGRVERDLRARWIVVNIHVAVGKVGFSVVRLAGETTVRRLFADIFCLLIPISAY